MKLSKLQEKLRSKKIADMSSFELIVWMGACDIMEKDVKFNKARRSWKKSRAEAQNELLKRNKN